MHFDCVFFDAGNTLLYPDPPVGEAYARTLGKRGIEADVEEVQLQFSRTWTALRVEQGSGAPPYGSTDAEARDWWRKVVLMTFEHFGAMDDPEGAFEELWGHFASPAAWRLYADALPAIETLKTLGRSVGLISNWDSRLVPVLRALSIWELFDTAVVSFQVGVEKPDPRIFHEALARCGVPPHRAIHVGDNYYEDALGAKAAGLRPLWLQRAQACPPEDPGVEVITTLTDVARLLQEAQG